MTGASAHALPLRTRLLVRVGLGPAIDARSRRLLRGAIVRLGRAARRKRSAGKQHFPKRLRVRIGPAGSAGHATGARRYRPLAPEGDLTAGPLLLPGNPGTFDASFGWDISLAGA